MTSRVPWLRIIAEGAAIVVSILLAFGIQAWWEGRQERRVELDILSGLRSDFEANREQLEDVIRSHEGFQLLLSELEHAAPAQLAEVRSDSLDVYGRAIQGSATFDARDATLDATIASGNLGTIQDARLRDLLAEWKAATEDLQEEAREWRDAAAKALDRVGALGGPWVADPNDTRLSTGSSSADALSRFPSPDLAAAASDQELQDLLRVKRFRGVIYLRYLTPLAPLADSILSALGSAGSR